MQAWNSVKVIKEGDEHQGRAGVVQKVDGDQITVMLDETDTHNAGDVVFDRNDLQVIGTGT